MGEPVRIADIAKRLSARSARPVDIVYTGLRPGEKLAEDLLGADEVDYRPRHPLIRHAKVTPLDPEQLSCLTVHGDDISLRRRLAECATETPREEDSPGQVPPGRLQAAGWSGA
jgi:FlaA1/EpsC-like NDP-sugar epimerase